MNLAFNDTALNSVNKFPSRTHHSNRRLAFFLSVFKERAILLKRAGLQTFQLKMAFKISELSVFGMILDIPFNHLSTIQGTRHFGQTTSVGNMLALVLCFCIHTISVMVHASSCKAWSWCLKFLPHKLHLTSIRGHFLMCSMEVSTLNWVTQKPRAAPG